MQISAHLSYKEDAGAKLLRIVLNQDIGEASGTMGYRITTGPNGILLEGYDENGAAQGLYFLEDLMNLAEAPAVSYGTIARKAMFSPRFAQSPFGMFEYNDAALAHMAHLGKVLQWKLRQLSYEMTYIRIFCFKIFNLLTDFMRSAI